MSDPVPQIDAPELEPYELTKKIGDGGMGTVYSAKNRETGETVAIKLMHPELAEDEEAVAHFLEVSRAVMALAHPNIVRLSQVGQLQQTKQPFVVMEQLEGTDLGDLLSEHRVMDFGRVLNLAEQIASALEVAHDAGILHLDIKPSNIFVTVTKDASGESERVKLLDFGATCVPRQFVAAEPGIGTPEYWSPEQASRGELDGRSDLYSLGVVIYEALNGGPPFTSHSYSELVFQHLRHTPPELARIPGNPTDPEAVRAVVRRCLHKDPKQRFQSARELSAALAGVSRQRVLVHAEPTENVGYPAVPAPRSRRSWVPVVAVAVVILAVSAMLALGHWILGTRSAASSAAVASPKPAPAPQRVSVTFTSEPSGAYVYETGGGPPLGRTPVELQLPRRTEPMTLLFRFPDGGRAEIKIVPDRATVAHAQSPNLAKATKKATPR